MKFGTKMIKIYIERFRVSRKRKAIVAGKDDPRRENEMVWPYRFLRIAEKEKKETRFRHGNLQGSFIVSIYNLSSFFFLFSLSLPSYLTIKYDVIRLRVAGIIKREGHAGRQLNSHELCVHEGLRDFCRAFPRRRVFPCNFPDRPSPPLSQ